MTVKPVYVIAALGAAFAVLAARSSRAYAPVTPGNDNASDPGEFTGPIYEDGTGMQTPYDSALDNAYVRAFLFMIRSLEHNPADVAAGLDYSTFYKGSRFYNLADHPVLTGEKRGIPLSSAMCIAAGFADGICVSTAAGGYQIIIPTWNDVRGMFPRLPDFTPASQDVAAVRILRKAGALTPLMAGDIETALRKASPKWASLPFSTAQQNPKSLQYALTKFNEGLGA